MSERAARLRAHQSNIERYEKLLKTSLSEIELRFLEKCLSEERFSLAMLEFVGPSSLNESDRSDALR
jgi:hypothetical protein